MSKLHIYKRCEWSKLVDFQTITKLQVFYQINLQKTGKYL